MKELFPQLPALVLALAYPWLAAHKDAIQIEANGRLDTLKKEWHGINVRLRIWIFCCIGLAANFGIPGFRATALFVAYLLLVNAIHWLLFDYRLNTLRGLDPWYQGQNAASDHYASKRNKLLAIGVSLALYLAAVYWVLRNIE
jgi:hypothetical protein